MMVTYVEIANAIRDVLNPLLAAGTLKDNRGYDDLREGINQWPTAETYFQSSDWDRVTFGAVVQRVAATFHTDIYVEPRGDMAADWKAVMEMIDAVEGQVIAQPLLSDLLSKVKWVTWRIERALLERAGERYPGLRIVWTVIIF